MSEDRFDEVIVEIARDYNTPPPVPREEMWAAIRAARAAEVHPRFRRWYAGWTAWGIGIAAVLMIGIGLGRLSVRPVASLEVAAAPSRGTPSTDVTIGMGETAYHLAANQHLSQAELLLTSFRSEARDGAVDARVGVWAKDLLSTTRLLLDSPAGADPKLKVLLEDLELVLVQLSQLPPNDTTEEAKQELEMANDAIEEAGVLPKIRTALQGGASTTPSQEEL
jgi:hypothetical protein